MKKILCVFLSFIFTITLVLPFSVVFASEKVQNLFDYSSIENDFGDKTYSEFFDVEKEISVYFLEYAYSSYTSADYALYAYVYNPTGIKINAKSNENRLQFSVNYDTDGNPVNFGKYCLEYCSQTDDGLITKYRIDCNIYNQLSADARKYFLSSIEIDTVDGIKDYSVGAKYTFTGFAKGYGSEESTLKVQKDYMETITIETGHTYYRVQSDEIGKYEDIQTVYFNIPHEYIQKYGNIYSMSAVWKERYTTPILICNNENTVNAFKSQLCKNVELGSGLGFRVDNYADRNGIVGMEYWRYGYNTPASFPGRTVDKVYNVLNYAFYSDLDFSSGNVLLKSSELLNYLKACNYADSMFEKTDLSHYDLENPEVFLAENMNTVERYEVAKWWQHLLSFGTVQTVKADNPEFTTIEKLSYSNDIGLSKDKFAEKYYVNEADVLDIKKFMESSSDTYLFRFTVTPYVVDTDVVFDGDMSDGSLPKGDRVIAQTTVIQDFDFIDVTFLKEGVYTTLAVVHDPQAFVADIEYPGEIVFPDIEDDMNWLMIACSLICLLIFVLIAGPFIPYIVSFVIKFVVLIIKLLLLPFKMIVNLISDKRK